MKCNLQESEYDISVIVATYNQDIHRTLLTIHSIIIQKEVTIQLIIADDGSDRNNFIHIRSYLENQNVKNYILLENDNNVGTVRNYTRCRNVCNSKYTKLISPGDFLYGDHILKEWMDFMESGNFAASFSDVIYYQDIDDIITPIKFKSFPQNIQIYKSDKHYEKRAFYQLVYNDYWLGSAVFCRTDVLFCYLEIISGRVKYGEDNIYRIIAGDDLPRGYFECDTMLYEYNVGVSSQAQKDDSWHNALLKDWYTTSQIILGKASLSIKLKKKLAYFSHWKMKNKNRGFSKGNTGFWKFVLRLLELYVHIPGLFFWHLRRYIHPRYTSMSLDMEKVNRIFTI